jgi:hypothetical protein
VYIGYTVLGFAVAYFATRQYRTERPEIKMLSYLVACFLVLAMPMVRILNQTLFALPSALLHYVPFLNNFRGPYRYSIMIMLFLPILSSLFIKRRVLDRVPKRIHPLVVSGLVLLLFVEYAQKDYPMVSSGDVPRVYHRLAAMEDGVLLEIPFGLRDGFHHLGDERTVEMFYQTVHHKKLLAGLVSRPDRQLFQRFEQEPVVADLIRMEDDPQWTPPAAPSPKDVTAFLRTFGVGYILIHPEYRDGPIEQMIQSLFSDRIIRQAEVDGFNLLTLRREPSLSNPSYPSAGK